MINHPNGIYITDELFVLLHLICHNDTLCFYDFQIFSLQILLEKFGLCAETHAVSLSLFLCLIFNCFKSFNLSLPLHFWLLFN